MTIKSFTKLSLSALLLAAATHSAIAEDPAEPTVVTLGNNTAISWSQFVNALNNPASITGSVDPESQVAKDKADAETALNTANNALNSAKENVNTKQSDVNTATSNVSSAEAEVTAANEKVDKAENDVNRYTTELSTTKNAYDKANSTVASLTDQISQKQTEYSIAKENLENAEKQTEKTTPLWLEQAVSAAATFHTAYSNNNSAVKIWYKIKEDRNGDALYLSYSEPSSSDLSDISESWTESNASIFYDNVVKNTTVSVERVMIFLGSNYTTTTNHCLAVAITSKKNIAEASKDAVAKLKESGQYGDYVNQADRDKFTTEKNNLWTEITNLTKQKADFTTPDAKWNPADYTPAEGESNMTQLQRLKYDYDQAQTNLTAANQAVTTANQAVTKAQQAVETATQALNKANQALSTAKADVTTAETSVATAKANLATAQAAYDAAVDKANADAFLPYKDVTLTADVTADAAITTTFDGTIDGDGHVITLSGSAPYLFKNLTGHVVNVAVNGKIFNGQNGAALTSVASWDGTTGVYYNESNQRSETTLIGALGFNARNNFGVDLSNNKLARLAEETKVYSITVYKSATNSNPAYVNLKNGEFFNGTDLGITKNIFVKSATDDFGNIANVFYTDNGENKCKTVTLSDRYNVYCPVDITATTMTFDRTFNGDKGMNAVCLPFDLSATAHESIDALCKYDVETADKFWFKKIEGTIPANTPFLLYSKEGSADFSLGEFQNITIKQTPREQIVEYGGDAEDPSTSFGTLKKASREEFKGSFQSYKVYALSGNTFSPLKGETNVPALRMVITSELAQNNGQQAPRRIAIVDEKGVEITDDIITGVENVAEENSSLNIAGGQGEIVITSDADYGKVEVYTMAGGVAAVADVMAGTTSVSLQKGIYIVMGKKVMVK